MQFENVATLLAEALEAEHDISAQEQNVMLTIRGDIPATVAFIKEIDGLLWFEQKVYLGVVIEPSQVPLHTLLYDNRKRESSFFLQNIHDVHWLGLKDRYALSVATPEKEISDVLTVRIIGMMGFLEWNLPGVRLMSGFDPG